MPILKQGLKLTRKNFWFALLAYFFYLLTTLVALIPLIVLLLVFVGSIMKSYNPDWGVFLYSLYLFGLEKILTPPFLIAYGGIIFVCYTLIFLMNAYIKGCILGALSQSIQSPLTEKIKFREFLVHGKNHLDKTLPQHLCFGLFYSLGLALIAFGLGAMVHLASSINQAPAFLLIVSLGLYFFLLLLLMGALSIWKELALVSAIFEDMGAFSGMKQGFRFFCERPLKSVLATFAVYGGHYLILGLVFLFNFLLLALQYYLNLFLFSQIGLLAINMISTIVVFVYAIFIHSTYVTLYASYRNQPTEEFIPEGLSKKSQNVIM